MVETMGFKKCAPDTIPAAINASTTKPIFVLRDIIGFFGFNMMTFYKQSRSQLWPLP
jgi:hypothetical protein